MLLIFFGEKSAGRDYFGQYAFRFILRVLLMKHHRIILLLTFLDIFVAVSHAEPSHYHG